MHLWTSNEEKVLISIRGEFDEQFNKKQRHDVLWKEATKKISSLGVHVTNVQVKNKWNKLKKDYRKAVDENNNTEIILLDLSNLKISTKSLEIGHQPNLW